MNKLIIDESVILEGKSDIKLREKKYLNVKSVNIKVKENSDIIIENKIEDIKLNIEIDIANDINLNIFEIKRGKNFKIRYTYNLEKNSSLNIEKINDGNIIKEEIIFNLNKENAEVKYNLKTICKKEERYNLIVYHNAKKTKSDINNNGVNILDGKLEFTVSSFVPKGNIRCDVSQSGRIINETTNECIVKPNLFIDEEDVNASHSASIGTFKEEQLFYIMTRGIEKKEAKKLLSKGFLLDKITYHREKLNSIIDEYWG